MSNQRIPLITDPSEKVQEALKLAFHHEGEPLRLFTTVAHHPRLLKGMIYFGAVFMANGLLSTRIRELVILRTGWRTRCEYEFGQHRLIGAAEGITDAEVLRLTQATLDGWEGAELAGLRMVDDLDADGAVSAETWELLAEHFPTDQVLELMAMSGFYRMLAGVINSVGITVEPGIPGWPAGAE